VLHGIVNKVLLNKSMAAVTTTALPPQAGIYIPVDIVGDHVCNLGKPHSALVRVDAPHTIARPRFTPTRRNLELSCFTGQVRATKRPETFAQ
jgi:hypothetical protein